MLNKKLVDKIKAILKDNYFENDEYGYYYQDILADYRDILSENTIKSIVNSENPLYAFNNLFYEWDLDCYEYEELYKTLKRRLGEEIYEKYEDDIVDWIKENVYFNPPCEHYEKQEVLVNIIVDTRDGNYDYTLNNFLNYCAPDIEALEIEEESSVLWLVKQQGYTKGDLIDVIKFKHDKENKFLDSLNEELLNSCTSINALTFSVRMELGELIDLLDDPKDIVLDSSTSCGLVDFWHGSGSLLDIHLDKEVIIKEEYARITVDGNVGYSIREIYGISPKHWTKTVLAA